MIKLYHSPRSRSARIVWLLEEIGLPYEIQALQFTPESMKGPEYLEVNPLGKVPSIQDNGLTMYESGAIVEYILEKYGKGRLAPAPGSAGRPMFLQWLHFAEATAMPPLADIAQHSFLRAEADRIPAVVADAQVRACAVLDVIETALAGRQYLLGDQFSAADIMMGYSLQLARWFGLLTDKYPNIVAYMGRLEQRPAFSKAFG
jgi:glutathione S-transferase